MRGNSYKGSLGSTGQNLKYLHHFGALIQIVKNLSPGSTAQLTLWSIGLSTEHPV